MHDIYNSRYGGFPIRSASGDTATVEFVLGQEILEMLRAVAEFEEKGNGSEPRVCPVCGQSLQETLTTGETGCGECYRTFSKEIARVLRMRHLLPDVPSDREREMRRLRDQLRLAILQENYEEASRLRSLISDEEER